MPFPGTKWHPVLFPQTRPRTPFHGCAAAAPTASARLLQGTEENFSSSRFLCDEIQLSEPAPQQCAGISFLPVSAAGPRCSAATEGMEPQAGVEEGRDENMGRVTHGESWGDLQHLSNPFPPNHAVQSDPQHHYLCSPPSCGLIPLPWSCQGSVLPAELHTRSNASAADGEQTEGCCGTEIFY